MIPKAMSVQPLRWLGLVGPIALACLGGCSSEMDALPGNGTAGSSGMGTGGKSMWSQVKGRTERDLLALFPAATMIRLGALRPMHGERSKAPGGGVLLTLLSPLWPVFQWLWPSGVITSEELGRAMIRAARDGAPARVLESADLVALGRSTH